MALKANYSQITDDKRTGCFYEGKEIVLTKSSGKPLKQARHNRKWWPEDKRIEVATLWAATRNLSAVHKLTGVPVKVINGWRDEVWFQEVCSKVRREKNDVLDAKITQALDKTVDILLDRYEHGEMVYDRTAKAYRRDPVRVKDIAYMTNVIFDKRQILRGEPTSRTESVSSDTKLKELKENFEKLAKSKEINPESKPIEGKAKVIKEKKD